MTMSNAGTGATVLAQLRAPVDPRLRNPPPPLGELSQQARLEKLVTRVLAPNPSMLALDGTNSYLVGVPGSGEVAIVDPGPLNAEHLIRVQRLLAEADAVCRWILVTHGHVDHAEAALPWADLLKATVAAASPQVVGPSGRVLTTGDRVTVGSTVIDVIPTPGHCSDHLAFRLESGAVLVGDHILGRGSSVITYPEGDLLAYLDSLRRVLDLGPSALYPGHGPEMLVDPSAVIRYYLDHRRYRELQILAVLAEGPADAGTLVRRVYAEVSPSLWPYAQQSTRTALQKLAAEGTIELEGSSLARLV